VLQIVLLQIVEVIVLVLFLGQMWPCLCRWLDRCVSV